MCPSMAAQCALNGFALGKNNKNKPKITLRKQGVINSNFLAVQTTRALSAGFMCFIVFLLSPGSAVAAPQAGAGESELSTKPERLHNRNNIQVSVVETRVKELPPMIKAKDIENFSVIENHSNKDFEFSFLRAVYFGNKQALSTVIYLNLHDPRIIEKITSSIGDSMEQDSSYRKVHEAQAEDNGNSDYKLGIAGTDDPPPAPPEEQYTIGGYPFEGDYYNKNFIRNLEPSANFIIPKNEQLRIMTQSAGTYLGNTLRYKNREIALEFIDRQGEVIDKVIVAID